METLINIIGWFMIWMIIDYKRKGESVIKTFSSDYFVVFVVTIIGVILATIKLN